MTVKSIVTNDKKLAMISSPVEDIGEAKQIIDDMIDTAGTITHASLALKENGAKRVVATCAHAVLSGPALDRINESALEEVIVTNNVSEAIEHAKGIANKQDMILVTGSLFTVCEAKDFLV